MAMVRCKFLGARTLKDGSKTGMLIFPESADKHTLVDLEGEVYLTNQIDNPGKDALFADIKEHLQRINDYIDINSPPIERELPDRAEDAQ
uniref:Uncharacterized protein n=1 Tax=viral metagenome TaxID=1070528 RepID=A0A6H1Z9X1_9ZZZZ